MDILYVYFRVRRIIGVISLVIPVLMLIPILVSEANSAYGIYTVFMIAWSCLSTFTKLNQTFTKPSDATKQTGLLSGVAVIAWIVAVVVIQFSGADYNPQPLDVRWLFNLLFFGWFFVDIIDTTMLIWNRYLPKPKRKRITTEW